MDKVSGTREDSESRPGPAGVRAIIHVEVMQGRLRFGIVATHNEIPSWAWFVGSRGVCLWTVGSDMLPGNGTGLPAIPNVAGKIDSNTLERVDVILVQGLAPPALSDSIWEARHVKAIVWTMGSTRGGRRRCPDGWTSVTRRFAHARLGGVTDGWFTIGYAFRGPVRLRPDTSSGSSFPNFLRQIWKPTSSGRTVPIPGPLDPTENTGLGLLDWKRRDWVQVRGPTVYSKTNWIARKVTRRELVNALDMPADIYEKASDKWQELMSKQKVPGKVLAYALRALQLGEEGKCEGVMDPKVIGKGGAGSTSNENQPDSKDVSHLSQAATDSGSGQDLGARKLCKRPRTMLWQGAGNQEEVTRVRKHVRFEEENIPQASSVEQDTGLSPEKEMVRWEGKTGSTVSDKAVKADNAEVPSELWDRRLIEGSWINDALREETITRARVDHALKGLRKWFLEIWKKRVCRSFVTWAVSMRHASEEERRAAIEAGALALSYVHRSSWWEWTGGSGVFFWRCYWLRLPLKDNLKIRVVDAKGCNVARGNKQKIFESTATHR